MTSWRFKPIITVKRYGFVIRLKPEAVERYKACHQEVWPEVLDRIARSHIRNYSIYLKDSFLFAYYEYHGNDHKTDMEAMAADPKTREWWAITMPMQEPLERRSGKEWWAEMEQVFHVD